MSKIDDLFNRLYEPIQPEVDENLPRSSRGIGEDPKTNASKKMAEPFVARADGSFSTQKPLTLEEAKIVNDRVNLLRAQIERIRSKTKKAEGKILSQMEGADLPSFKLDISGKPKLRKATKVVFGSKADEITFTMYRQALEEKIALEKADSDSMFEEDPDNSSQNIMDMLKGVM